MAGSFLSAWLGGDPVAAGLVPSLPGTPEARAALVRAAGRASPASIEALRAYDEALPKSPSRRGAIDALGDGAAAVVTGQQVGLFLGPLYTFYKAASAIRLARALEAESGRRCVPVFWLASEDHDHAEINHCFVNGPTKISLPTDERRLPVSERLLGADVTAAIDALAEMLGGQPYADEVLALVREAYRPERSYVAAFAQLLARCFAEEGLVILDPRDAAMAVLTLPILRRAIREHTTIERGLVERAAVIEAAGYPVQVALRPRSPLVFHHPDGAAGPRQRLEVRDAGFAILDRELTLAELDAAAPGSLSSSALLRPIVQDTLLPTVAYVGGPGELAYFAQLAPLYACFGITQPAFSLRARLRILDGTTRSLLERTGLSAADLEAPREAILARVVRSDLPPPESLRARLLDPVQLVLAELAAQAPSLDENLRRPIARTRETIEQAVTRLVDRYARARLEKDQVAVDRIDRLRAALFPEGAPQERVLGFAAFAAAVGLERWKASILDAVHPFDATIKDLPL